MDSEVWEEDILYVSVVELHPVHVQLFHPIARPLSQLFPVGETIMIEMARGVLQSCDSCGEEIFNVF